MMVHDLLVHFLFLLQHSSDLNVTNKKRIQYTYMTTHKPGMLVTWSQGLLLLFFQGNAQSILYSSTILSLVPPFLLPPVWPACVGHSISWRGCRNKPHWPVLTAFTQAPKSPKPLGEAFKEKRPSKKEPRGFRGSDCACHSVKENVTSLQSPRFSGVSVPPHGTKIFHRKLFLNVISYAFRNRSASHSVRPWNSLPV